MAYKETFIAYFRTSYRQLHWTYIENSTSVGVQANLQNDLFIKIYEDAIDNKRHYTMMLAFSNKDYIEIAENEYTDGNLSVVYQDIKNKIEGDKAEDLYRRALEIYKRVITSQTNDNTTKS